MRYFLDLHVFYVTTGSRVVAVESHFAIIYVLIVLCLSVRAATAGFPPPSGVVLRRYYFHIHFFIVAVFLLLP
jgi:hypothetical protein